MNGSDGAASDWAPPSVESFHRALEAALRSRVVLDLGRSDADHGKAGSSATGRSRHAVPSGWLNQRKLRTLSQIHRSQRQSPYSSQVASPSDAASDPVVRLAAEFGEIAGSLPQKYVNGFAVYCLTGRTDLVLDAMSVDRRAERELSRVARPSLVYLVVLVLVGVVGALFVAITLQTLDHLREDMLLMPRSSATQSDLVPWITPWQFAALPWVALLLTAIFVTSLLRPISAGIAKCIGGFGYVMSQRQAVAASVEHALVESGVDSGQAEQQVSRLIGLPSRRKGAPRTVSRGDQSPSDIQRLRFEAGHHHTHANNRLRHLRVGLPLLLVMTIGAAGVLVYCLAMFVPLTTLLYELAAPPLDPVFGRSTR